MTLVGRSGCGKSTLLRVLAGLIPASEGRVTIAGREVHGPSRDVALAFQRPALLPWRNVLQNVLLPVEILGLDKRAHRKKAEELLALVGLAGFEDRRPTSSRGACSSVWRCAGRSSTSRGCCSWTSRSPRSMR